ncbi:MAG: hypothetical protein EOO45_22380 [Flavobacterium sp.]|nr:MAG: hypothetical protein EOO45_22380 [Flavobacterium sp.]
MNRFLKVSCIIAAAAFFTFCKRDDDGTSTPPPRDYTEQYATEKVDIENYISTHYIENVTPELDITFKKIDSSGSQISIKDQQQYPLQSKLVTFEGVEYTVYYLVLREGVGKAPTRADNIIAAYRGTFLDNIQFENNPFPQTPSSLALAVRGWQEIIPLFREGVYNDIPNNPDPASYSNYGAGVMFLPSALAYYNRPPASSNPVIPSYATMIFSFKLYRADDVDSDLDGIVNRFETVPGTDIADYDTDGDGIPNYADTDDDGDGFLTKDEINGATVNSEDSFNLLATCSGGTLKIHLDPACN